MVVLYAPFYMCLWAILPDAIRRFTVFLPAISAVRRSFLALFFSPLFFSSGVCDRMRAA
jgi:hypothetical protein